MLTKDSKVVLPISRTGGSTYGVLRILTALNALTAITGIFMGVICIRHSLRRIILHTGNRHV